MKDVILYHGSRGGIDGSIKPISRVRSDFGAGFYMGENPEQAKGLVVEDAEPYFYTLKFKLSEIPEEKILKLNENDWLYVILANRKKCSDFNELPLCSNILNKLSDYDVIIGPIADDRMNEAMKRFTDYGLTDKGLQACLKHVKYGNQYVAKTEFACSKIEIISERQLYGKEADDIRNYVTNMRMQSRDIIKTATIEYQRKGKYLNEIITEELMKDNMMIFQE